MLFDVRGMSFGIIESMTDFRSRRQRLNILVTYKIARFLFFGFVGLVIVVFVLFIWYSRDLPTPAKLSASNLSQSTRILDRNGIVLYDVFKTENRTYVELKEIPLYVRQATIAIENKDFYENQGFSLMGYLRVLKDFVLLRRVTGGSTITQQLVKNTLLSSERTIPRKMKEFILSMQVERKYSKDQILELYLNVAPYGGTAVGIEAAAEKYFGKKAKDLSLVESTILAGFPQRPSFYSPYGPNKDAYQRRTKDVLRRMREDGYISRKQELDSVKMLENIAFLPKSESIKAPHFSFYVKDLLVKQFGNELVEQGGLQVTTTLDFPLQQKTEEIVREEIEAARFLKVGNGASIVLDPKTGEILVMVGSKDFFDQPDEEEKEKTKADTQKPFEGQFNVVVQGLRQPGSAIKPITYATALERGYTASSLLMDTKVVFPNPGEKKDYEPENYDKKFHGPVQMRFTLGSSLNIPAVKTLALVGVKNMLTTAYAMGLTTLEPSDNNIKRFGLSITLGGGEVRLIDLASSYSAFANGGYRIDPISILKVTDRKGNVLYEHKNTQPRRVIT